MPTPDGPPIPAGPPRFPLGQLVATPAALASLVAAGVSPWSLLARHAQGDWGDLGEEDRQLNVLALIQGSRLLSAYTLPDKTRVWVVTEADRSATSLILPRSIRPALAVHGP